MPKSQKFVGVWVDPEQLGFRIRNVDIQKDINDRYEAERAAAKPVYRERQSNYTRRRGSAGSDLSSVGSSHTANTSRTAGSNASSSTAVSGVRREGTNRGGQPK